ncbi:hypothetical protein Esti_004145 [Eimeria stiedai]
MKLRCLAGIADPSQVKSQGKRGPSLSPAKAAKASLRCWLSQGRAPHGFEPRGPLPAEQQGPLLAVSPRRVKQAAAFEGKLEVFSATLLQQKQRQQRALGTCLGTLSAALLLHRGCERGCGVWGLASACRKKAQKESEAILEVGRLRDTWRRLLETSDPNEAGAASLSASTPSGRPPPPCGVGGEAQPEGQQGSNPPVPFYIFRVAEPRASRGGRPFAVSAIEGDTLLSSCSSSSSSCRRCCYCCKPTSHTCFCCADSATAAAAAGEGAANPTPKVAAVSQAAARQRPSVIQQQQQQQQQQQHQEQHKRQRQPLQQRLQAVTKMPRRRQGGPRQGAYRQQALPCGPAGAAAAAAAAGVAAAAAAAAAAGAAAAGVRPPPRPAGEGRHLRSTNVSAAAAGAAGAAAVAEAPASAGASGLKAGSLSPFLRETSSLHADAAAAALKQTIESLLAEEGLVAAAPPAAAVLLSSGDEGSSCLSGAAAPNGDHPLHLLDVQARTPLQQQQQQQERGDGVMSQLALQSMHEWRRDLHLSPHGVYAALRHMEGVCMRGAAAVTMVLSGASAAAAADGAEREVQQQKALKLLAEVFSSSACLLAAQTLRLCVMRSNAVHCIPSSNSSRRSSSSKCSDDCAPGAAGPLCAAAAAAAVLRKAAAAAGRGMGSSLQQQGCLWLSRDQLLLPVSRFMLLLLLSLSIPELDIQQGIAPLRSEVARSSFLLLLLLHNNSSSGSGVCWLAHCAAAAAAPLTLHSVSAAAAAAKRYDLLLPSGQLGAVASLARYCSASSKLGGSPAAAAGAAGGLPRWVEAAGKAALETLTACADCVQQQQGFLSPLPLREQRQLPVPRAQQLDGLSLTHLLAAAAHPLVLQPLLTATSHHICAAAAAFACPQQQQQQEQQQAAAKCRLVVAAAPKLLGVLRCVGQWFRAAAGDGLLLPVLLLLDSSLLISLLQLLRSCCSLEGLISALQTPATAAAAAAAAETASDSGALFDAATDCVLTVAEAAAEALEEALLLLAARNLPADADSSSSSSSNSSSSSRRQRGPPRKRQQQLLQEPLRDLGGSDRRGCSGQQQQHEQRHSLCVLERLVIFAHLCSALHTDHLGVSSSSEAAAAAAGREPLRPSAAAQASRALGAAVSAFSAEACVCLTLTEMETAAGALLCPAVFCRLCCSLCSAALGGAPAGAAAPAAAAAAARLQQNHRGPQQQQQQQQQQRLFSGAAVRQQQYLRLPERLLQRELQLAAVSSFGGSKQEELAASLRAGALLLQQWISSSAWTHKHLYWPALMAAEHMAAAVRLLQQSLEAQLQRSSSSSSPAAGLAAAAAAAAAGGAKEQQQSLELAAVAAALESSAGLWLRKVTFRLVELSAYPADLQNACSLNDSSEGPETFVALRSEIRTALRNLFSPDSQTVYTLHRGLLPDLISAALALLRDWPHQQKQQQQHRHCVVAVAGRLVAVSCRLHFSRQMQQLIQQQQQQQQQQQEAQDPFAIIARCVGRHMQQLLLLAERLRLPAPAAAAGPGGAAAALAPYRQLVAAACTFVLQALEAFVAACLTTCFEGAAAAAAAAASAAARPSDSAFLAAGCCCCSSKQVHARVSSVCMRRQQQQQQCPLYTCVTLKRLGFYSVRQRAARQQQQQAQWVAEGGGTPSPVSSASADTAAAASLAACHAVLQLLVLQLNEFATTLRFLVGAAAEAAVACNGQSQQVGNFVSAVSSFLSLAAHAAARLSPDLPLGVSGEIVAAAAAVRAFLGELQLALAPALLGLPLQQQQQQQQRHAMRLSVNGGPARGGFPVPLRSVCCCMSWPFPRNSSSSGGGASAAASKVSAFLLSPFFRVVLDLAFDRKMCACVLAFLGASSCPRRPPVVPTLRDLEQRNIEKGAQGFQQLPVLMQALFWGLLRCQAPPSAPSGAPIKRMQPQRRLVPRTHCASSRIHECLLGEKGLPRGLASCGKRTREQQTPKQETKLSISCTCNHGERDAMRHTQQQQR